MSGFRDAVVLMSLVLAAGLFFDYALSHGAQAEPGCHTDSECECVQ